MITDDEIAALLTIAEHTADAPLAAQCRAAQAGDEEARRALSKWITRKPFNLDHMSDARVAELHDAITKGKP